MIEDSKGVSQTLKNYLKFLAQIYRIGKDQNGYSDYECGIKTFFLLNKLSYKWYLLVGNCSQWYLIDMYYHVVVAISAVREPGYLDISR